MAESAPDPIGVRLIGLDRMAEDMIRFAIDASDDLQLARDGEPASVVVVGVEDGAVRVQAVDGLTSAVPRVLGVEAARGVACVYELRRRAGRGRDVDPVGLAAVIRDACRSPVVGDTA
jgi:hypothetical protein